MSKRQPAPVRLLISDAASAFGLTIPAVRQFIDAAGIAQGDRVEIGALASFIARTTIGGGHVEAA